MASTVDVQQSKAQKPEVDSDFFYKQGSPSDLPIQLCARATFTETMASYNFKLLYFLIAVALMFWIGHAKIDG